MLSLTGCSALLATKNNTEIVKTQENGTSIILLDDTEFFLHQEDQETNQVTQKKVNVDKNTIILVGLTWKPTLDYVLKEVKVRAMVPDSSNVLHENTITIPKGTVIRIGNHWESPEMKEQNKTILRAIPVGVGSSNDCGISGFSSGNIPIIKGESNIIIPIGTKGQILLNEQIPEKDIHWAVEKDK